MRNGDDKIVIATDHDDHGIYFSVQDRDDNGTIIDFVQKREGCNLGEARKILRQAARDPVTDPNYPAHQKPIASSPNRQHILHSYNQAHSPDHHPYLASRGISDSTLQDPRFKGVVRLDHRGNAVFPHFDQDGLAGYEMKNQGFTGFSKGGTKRLWHTTNLRDADNIVIVESAIDALSHAQLNKTGENTAYISVGGEMNDKQRELIKNVTHKAANRQATITLATDNDQGGEKLAKEINDLSPSHAKIERDKPKQKDWNEVLQRTRKPKRRMRMGRSRSGPTQEQDGPSWSH